jgi:hypothetical protein
MNSHDLVLRFGLAASRDLELDLETIPVGSSSQLLSRSRERFDVTVVGQRNLGGSRERLSQIDRREKSGVWPGTWSRKARRLATGSSGSGFGLHKSYRCRLQKETGFFCFPMVHEALI